MFAAVTRSRLVSDCRARYQLGQITVGTSDCAVARGAHPDLTEPERLGLVEVTCGPNVLAVRPTAFAAQLGAQIEWLAPPDVYGFVYVDWGTPRFELGPLQGTATGWSAALSTRCETTDAGRRLEARGWSVPTRDRHFPVLFTREGERWAANPPPSSNGAGPEHMSHPMFHL